MGFGSYDESEQENQELDNEEGDTEAVSVEENSHRGDVEFESEATTDELVDRLQDIKEE